MPKATEMVSQKRFFLFYKSFPFIPLFRVMQCTEKDLDLETEAQASNTSPVLLSCRVEIIAYDLTTLLVVGRNR